MNEDTEREKGVVAIRDDQYALVPSNLSVQLLANRWRWKPETAIARIKKHLPAVLEQQIYLAIAPLAGESGILPESMAKLLRLYLGFQELQITDIAPGSPGRMKFDSFAEFLGDCINLLKIVTKEYEAFSLKIVHAGMIVLQYGKDDPERLIEMVDCNLEEMCEMLGINNEIEYNKRMGMCVSVVVNKIIPMNRRNGSPDLLDLADFLNMTSAARHNLRRALSQEVPDYLSQDIDQLRNHDSLRILRDMEIL